MQRPRLPTHPPRVNVAIDRRRVAVAVVDRVALDLPLGRDRTHRLAGTYGGVLNVVVHLHGEVNPSAVLILQATDAAV
jgi:hypothetical protein